MAMAALSCCEVFKSWLTSSGRRRLLCIQARTHIDRIEAAIEGAMTVNKIIHLCSCDHRRNLCDLQNCTRVKISRPARASMSRTAAARACVWIGDGVKIDVANNVTRVVRATEETLETMQLVRHATWSRLRIALAQTMFVERNGVPLYFVFAPNEISKEKGKAR